MKNLRNQIYKLSLRIGLFFVMPLVIRLPEGVARRILRLKAFIRFKLGSYRAYVDRYGLRDIAVANISRTLNLNSQIAREKIQRLMYLEVISERNGFLLDKYDLSALRRKFIVSGLDILEREIKKQKGIILVTIHSGDTLLFGLYLSLMGYNIYGLFDSAILKTISSDPLFRFARLKDFKINGKIGKLYTDRGLKGLFDVLKNNGIIGWMIDLPPRSLKRATFVNFLGEEIQVNTSFLRVAVKAGSPIVPFICIYDFDNDRHEIHICEPFDPEERRIQEIYSLYEPYVRKNPESWLGWYFFDMLINKKRV